MSHGPFWRADEIETLLRHMARGVTDPGVLAEILGRSRGSTRKKMRDYGARFMPPKRDHSRRVYHAPEPVVPHGYGDQGRAQPYNPVTDPKPAFLRRGRS